MSQEEPGGYLQEVCFRQREQQLENPETEMYVGIDWNSREASVEWYE